MNENKKLIEGWCFVEDVGSDRKKVLWEVVDDNIVEEDTSHDEIGLRRFNLFKKKMRMGYLCLIPIYFSFSSSTFIFIVFN